MKIAVIGSRGFNDYNLLADHLDKLTGIECVVSGGAKGADNLAERYASENKIQMEIHTPDYGKYGRSAPIERNREIVRSSDMIIAFWDGRSKGTESVIIFARRIGKKIEVLNV